MQAWTTGISHQRCCSQFCILVFFNLNISKRESEKKRTFWGWWRPCRWFGALGAHRKHWVNLSSPFFSILLRLIYIKKKGNVRGEQYVCNAAIRCSLKHTAPEYFEPTVDATVFDDLYHKINPHVPLKRSNISLAKSRWFFLYIYIFVWYSGRAVGNILQQLIHTWIVVQIIYL